MNKTREELKRIIEEGFKEIILNSSWKKDEIMDKLVDQLEEKWAEEIVDNMYQAYNTYGGVYLVNNILEKIVEKYLNVSGDSVYEEDTQRVKIKVRKGAILIERIN